MTTTFARHTAALIACASFGLTGARAWVRRAAATLSRPAGSPRAQFLWIAGVTGVDTRRLVRRLRDGGAIRGGVSTELSAGDLLDRVRAHPVLDGRDLAREAAGPRRSLGRRGPAAAAIHCGLKASLARRPVAAGCRPEAPPARPTAAHGPAGKPDPRLASNGPDDPAAAKPVNIAPESTPTSGWPKATRRTPSARSLIGTQCEFSPRARTSSSISTGSASPITPIPIPPKSFCRTA